MRPVVCKYCGSVNKHYSTWCIMKPMTKQSTKLRQTHIKKAGKQYDKWKAFREDVAIPYLEATYGHTCRCCGAHGELDIDHIQSKGSHPSLKYELTNLQYLCRFPCHHMKTIGKPCIHV